MEAPFNLQSLSAPSTNNPAPEIPENLATDEDLCKDVVGYIYRNYFYPYLMNQQRFWPTWEAVDRAWRCMTPNQQLDYDPLAQKSQEWIKRNGKRPAGAAAIVPPAIYQQVNTLSTFALGASWKDGVPSKYIKPATLTEHPLYNPTTRTVQAANERLAQEAEMADLKLTYRKCYPDYIKYGHTWAHYDFDRRYEQVPDPQTGQMVWVPKTFYTKCMKLNVDQVYIDYTVGLDPIEQQDCPIIRRAVTNSSLYENEYDPELNPFGWTNIDLAIDNSTTQYAFSQTDMGYANELLRTRYNISDSSAGQRPYFTVKNLYTAYAMLRLYQASDGKWRLAKDGEQVSIVNNEGQEIQARVRPQRYIVEWYGYAGSPGTGGGTCLRIQRNPTASDLVPLSCMAHKVEDTSLSIPISVVEIAWGSFEQMATAINQFLDSKNYTINRPWVTNDPALVKENLNQPGKNIFAENPEGTKRAEGTNYDETATIIPFIQVTGSQIEDVMGANSTMRGEIGTGRRAASEVVAAFDSAQTPAIVDVDNFNAGLVGTYAKFALLNWNKWGDQNWIKAKTGGLFWPRMEIRSTMAKEFVDKMQATNNLRYFMEFLGNNPIFAQVLNPATAAVYMAQQMGLQGFENVINDGGLEKSREEAMNLVTQILGDGILTPPSPDDPDELFLTCFQQALRSDYWQTNAPQNFPLMWKRIESQQMQLQLKQNAQMMQRVEGMMLEAAAQSAGKPKPPKPKQSGTQSSNGSGASTGGQVAQREMGSTSG